MMTTQQNREVIGEYVRLDDEEYYRISNNHLMPDFFMSLVGASDHWMFISSQGALTAGRCDPDSALFPYAADDQISIGQAMTGSTTLIRLSSTNGDDASSHLWEPFAGQSSEADGICRNLYKTPLGNKLIFEEIHEREQVAFRYRWAFSEQFGFVRSCRLQNIGSQTRSIELLDGLQNVLPYGVGSEFMLRFSNLANAYKKSELLDGSQIGLYYLSSIPTDRAEPSEGLKATTVWQTGLDPDAVLISSEQVHSFRQGDRLINEEDVRGRAGAYLVNQAVELVPGASIEWHIVAELEQDHSSVIGLDHWLKSSDNPASEVQADIDLGQQNFLRIVSSADAMQCGSNARRSNRHLSNTVFNVMRGGIPLNDYQVDAEDFRKHVESFNRQVSERHNSLLNELPDWLSHTELNSKVSTVEDPDLTRLASEYLPLAFSRRHGDPTRPWNRFAIKLRSADGRTNLDYQGNWRDIFQNWEALAMSFPGFSTAMVCRFVNATTADGYNPYRVTKGGFEWEEPTPDDPWANIGYWGDHQIIYLLKLLEWNRRVDPSSLDELLGSSSFVHANVPYRIKPFEEILKDSRATIDFDGAMAQRIAGRVDELGADGKLLWTEAGEVHRVTLMEKLLTLSLAKLSNFVPDGGIWLNTQRPEWNDANNALVGNGLSMVTACYLYRWCDFLSGWLEDGVDESYSVSDEVAVFFDQIIGVLKSHAAALDKPLSGSERRQIVEALSRAGSDYRDQLYSSSMSGQTREITRDQISTLLDTAKRYLAATIQNNRRPDGLYHSYNLLEWNDAALEIEHLYEMLEGQVAVLSSGLLSASESLELLDALRTSRLYRENQNSFLLYPDRQLSQFLEKNTLDPEAVRSSTLLSRLLDSGNEQVVRRDVHGQVHFNGAFRNAADLVSALDKLPEEFRTDAIEERSTLSDLFEEQFGHRQFTGRSGTFFAYEGLGSIYWHMVSKLGLAVSENYFAAVDSGQDEDTVARLNSHYQSIRAGIGAEKSPTEYGAFPSDPYSHTPENAGVKQPGMTGQVKEDILARFAEIGVQIENGSLAFRLELFDRNELLAEPQEFTYCDLNGRLKSIDVPPSGFAFTFCQVPIVYRQGSTNSIRVRTQDAEERVVEGLQLDPASSRTLFARSGEIEAIECEFVART